MAVRQTQAASAYMRYTIACIGDSRFMKTDSGFAISDHPPAIIQLLLQQQGCLVKCRNFGVSGNTTQQMYLRAIQMLQYETPDMLVLWGGANDPGAGISATGGTTAVPTSTQTYLQAVTEFALANGVTRVLICNEPPLSYVPSSGGDTAASTLLTYSGATLAAAQAAAVATFGGDSRGLVAACDMFTSIKTVLSASAPGTLPTALYQVAGNVLRSPLPLYQASNSLLSGNNYPQPKAPTNYTLAWNLDSVPAAPYGTGIHRAATGDIHQNPFGMALIANAIVSAMPTAWLTALKVQ